MLCQQLLEKFRRSQFSAKCVWLQATDIFCKSDQISVTNSIDLASLANLSKFLRKVGGNYFLAGKHSGTVVNIRKIHPTFANSYMYSCKTCKSIWQFGLNALSLVDPEKCLNIRNEPFLDQFSVSPELHPSVGEWAPTSSRQSSGSFIRSPNP